MPYIAPKPRRQAISAQNSDIETKVASSSITPAFIKSSFEPVTKVDMYSPSRTSHPPVTFIPDDTTSTSTVTDTTDIISQAPLPHASTPSRNASVASKRSSWSHRKPVPSNLILPVTSIPSSHPFARGPSSSRSQLDLDAPPVSPRLTGPVPPRRPGVSNRSISNLATPASPAGSDMSEGSGMFWRPPIPETRNSEDTDERAEVLKADNMTTAPSSVENTPAAKLGRPTAIPSRQSSRHTIQTSIPELGAPVAFSQKGASPSTTHESQKHTRKVSPTHPLRLRMDKSLPALPLGQDDESTTGYRSSRHKVSTSTSSGPSTQIVTPRSDSQGFVLGDMNGEATAEEKRKVKWTKGLAELSWIKKEKGSKTTGIGGVDSDSGSPAQDDEKDEAFSVHGIPSRRRLIQAGNLFLTDENGQQVSFGDMFPQSPPPVESGQPVPPVPKTVIFFIRTFWCGQCQDYMFASMSQLDPVAIEKAGIRVIVISNGSWKIIKSYKKLFKCPFPIYVDGPRKLYSLFGMTKLTNDFGPMFKGRAAYHQRPVPTQVVHGVTTALTKMPLANPGKISQLGGEFVLSPGYNCDFAHRMTNRSNHMEAPDVLREAGCLHPTKSEVEEITIAENQLAEIERLEKEMEEWRKQRATELDRIRRRKAERRGEKYIPMTSPSMAVLDLDEELDQDRRSKVRRASSSSEAQAAVSLSSDVPKANDDGPMCSLDGNAQDALTWEDEEEASMFEELVQSGQLDSITTGMPMKDKGKGREIIEVEELKPAIAKRDFADATFGREFSGTGSGLEVRIVN